MAFFVCLQNDPQGDVSLVNELYLQESFLQSKNNTGGKKRAVLFLPRKQVRNGRKLGAISRCVVVELEKWDGKGFQVFGDFCLIL